ncbi:MAG TPA: tRNA pseudouridine(13) synthase TruD [Candidatus Nanoarchaeia archaeon]|nr:tRNA pseudouridine(13) synthase TruD [Candidatus Nanoarchaeia archaeon]
MYKTKEKPEDFIVEEMIDLDNSSGPYLYIKLTKKQWNTLDIISILQKKLHIQRSQIGYAGLKDKQGITTQYFSLFRITKKQIEGLKIKDVVIKPLYNGSKAITLGSLKANKFQIKLNEAPIKIDFIENYFGEQRFSKNNIQIGKCLITNNFKTAYKLITNQESNQPINELRKLDFHLLSLYLSAYQSYLWNKVTETYLETKYSTIEPKNIQIPLISFDAKFKNKKIEVIYKNILKEENITKQNFIIKQFPELINISKVRDLIVKILDFTIEDNKISFTLPKGSYATIVIEKMNYLKNFLNK